jgi:hypothetical protein
MNKITFAISVATVVLSVLNIIVYWDNTPAVYGWFVAATGWLQLCISERKN